MVGSINMDMTVTAERIPLKGETLKGEDIRYIPGGKGANQAVAMAKLGADVEMFGCVGGTWKTWEWEPPTSKWLPE